MDEVRTLTGLKNVFLAPLAKARPTENSASWPAGEANSAVSLHDNHNVELKTVSELGRQASVVETDIYLFVPRNFELPGFGKEVLIRDFRSRIRLALPVHGEQGSAAFEQALTDLLERLHTLSEMECKNPRELEFGHDACESALESAKDLCAVIAETLKSRASEHARRYLMSHTLMTIQRSAVAGLEELTGGIADTAALIVRFRSATDLAGKRSAEIVAFLDEYVSHLYVQYLGTVRTEFAKIAAPKGTENDLGYQRARIRLESMLDSLQEQEASHRSKFGGHADEESDLDRERRLVRLSHLKKFFQSKMFVDITRQRPATKMSNSTATIGTAMAAILTAIIQHFSQPEMIHVASEGMMVLGFGIIFYVLRDRMKDWAKTVFQKKASQFLPDFEQVLLAKDKKIGRVREWFHVVKPNGVPSDVLYVRRCASSSEMERRLPEDVFHCRKVQEVHAAGTAEGADPGTSARTLFLHENTRINFERYLKHMDDSFKDFTDLDPTGKFLHSRSHRVYHFYLCVKTVSRPAKEGLIASAETPSRSRTLLCRIVLDKSGVVRLEEIADEA